MPNWVWKRQPDFFPPEEKHELYPTAELFGVAMSIVSGKLREISTWQFCGHVTFVRDVFFVTLFDMFK